jgi:hypothetical protein
VTHDTEIDTDIALGSAGASGFGVWCSSHDYDCAVVLLLPLLCYWLLMYLIVR